MTRPSPGRPCEKKIMTRPSPGRPCEKKIMTRQAPAGLRKKNHDSFLAGLGLGWAGLGWAGLAPQSIKKALGFSVRRTWGIPRAQTLIKPVVYVAFWSSFCQMAPKSIKKAL